MIALAQKFDTGLKGLLNTICATFIVLMVFFTVWTVVMRYIFLNAPFWSDTLTMFFNVWMVFLALAITVRDRSHISMTMMYEILPPIVGFSCEFLWTVLICAFGIFIAMLLCSGISLLLTDSLSVIDEAYKKLLLTRISLWVFGLLILANALVVSFTAARGLLAVE